MSGSSIHSKLSTFAIQVVMGCLIAGPAVAQDFEVKVKTMRVVSSGAVTADFLWDTGEIITRDKARVKFQGWNDATGRLAGYQLAKVDIEAVKVGDLIPLHFYGIKATGRFPRWEDAAGAPLARDDFGGWRAVTLRFIEQSGMRVTIKFDEEITLEDGRKIQQLEYEAVGDFLVPAPPPARHQPGSPERFLIRRDHTFREGGGLTSTWGVGEVISRDGVTVRFQALEDADGTFAGYKLATTDLSALKPGDQVLTYFRSLKFSGDWESGFLDASGVKVFRKPRGGWRVVTIKAVGRTGGRVTIALKDAVELEDGSKISRVECQVVEDWCVPAPLAVSRPPSK